MKKGKRMKCIFTAVLLAEAMIAQDVNATGLVETNIERIQAETEEYVNEERYDA